MAIAWAVWAEQHHAVAVAAVAVGIVPALVLVEPHQRRDPALAVEVGPLVGEAQMRLDDAPADGLEIEHAGVAGEVLLDPRAAVLLDRAVVLGVNGPVVERALHARLAGRVAPPDRLPVEHRDIGRHVPAGEQRHPHVAGRVVRDVVGRGTQHAAADAHAFQVGDRLGKDRKALRLDAMRRGFKPLGERDRDLVVDPAPARIPDPRVGILGGNEHVGRTGDVLEILHAPRIGFADGHASRART